MAALVQASIMIQQRRLTVGTIQDPSHGDPDHEYMNARNEPKNNKQGRSNEMPFGERSQW